MSGLSLLRLSAPQTNARGLTPARLVAKWIEARATRTALGRLDAHLLKDIGLDEGTARAEMARPFWRE